MSYPLVQWVDAPSVGATVLFDFNNPTTSTGCKVLRSGWDLGTPQLEGDVDALDPVYGPRTMAWTARIQGSKAQSSALLSQLARRILAGPGWLRFQLTASTTPVWAATYRAKPGAVSMENVYADDGALVPDLWDVAMEVPAEPFFYGARETLATVTITNNPTSGTNPARVLLAAIKGDAPTPLRFKLVVSSSITYYGSPMVNLHSSTTARYPINVPIGASDGLTLGTDTTNDTSRANTVGTGSKKISFATDATMVTRLSGNIASVTPGRYKTLCRVWTDANTAARVRVTAWSGSVTADIGNDLGGWGWADLGDIELPPNRPRLAADAGPSLTVPFTLSASRTSGSGGMYVDHLLLIPVDTLDTLESSTLKTFVNPVDTTDTLVLDGDTEDVWVAVTATGALKSAAFSATAQGVFPRAIPGAANVLTTLLQVRDTPIDDDPSRTVAVTVSYYPRWLYPDAS